MAGRRCILLGGGGFIGTNLCRKLVAENAEVIVVSPHVISRKALMSAEWICASLEDIEKIGALIQPGDFIFHMVSTTLPTTSNENPIADISNNVLPTLRLLEVLRHKQIAKLIFLSSGGTVYGKEVPMPTPEEASNGPICSYGIQKLTIEKYLALYKHLYGLDSVTLRIANPFGAYQRGGSQGLVATIIHKAIMNQPITIWGDGSVVRDYIYVTDLVTAIIRAALLCNSNAPNIFNIGSGVGRSIQNILVTVQAIHNQPLNVAYEKGRAVDVPVSILDITRAQIHLDWMPIKKWEKALAETYEWVLQTDRLKLISIDTD